MTRLVRCLALVPAAAARLARGACRPVTVELPARWPRRSRSRRHPDAIPIAGGTDLMVEVNSGRRPPGPDDRPRRAARAAGTGSGATGRRPAGAAVPLHAADRGARRPGCTGSRRPSRTVASPQIRNRGTVGGDLGDGVAGRRRAAAWWRTTPWSRSASAAGADAAVADFLLGPKRTALAPDELSWRAVPRSRTAAGFSKIGARNAMVIAVAPFALVVRSVGAGRRRLWARPGRPPRAARDDGGAFAGRPRRGGAAAVAGAVAAEFGRLVRRRRGRSTTCAARAAYRRHAVGCWPAARWRCLGDGRAKAASRRRDHAFDGERCTFNGRTPTTRPTLGESLLRLLREHLGIPPPRTRASRASAARARSDGRRDRVRVPRAGGQAGAAGRDGRGRWRGAARSTRCSRRCSRPAACSVGSARPGWSWRRTTSCDGCRPVRRRHPRGPGRQPLPLHRLREDPRRGAAGRVGAARDDRSSSRAARSPRWTPPAPSSPTATSCRRTARSPPSAPAARPRPARRHAVVDARGCLATPASSTATTTSTSGRRAGYAQQATLFEWLVALYPSGRASTPTSVAAAAAPGSPRSPARAARPRPTTTTCSRATAATCSAPRSTAAPRVGLRFHPCRGSMDLGQSRRRPAAGLGRRGPRRDPRRQRRRRSTRYHDPSPGVDAADRASRRARRSRSRRELMREAARWPGGAACGCTRTSPRPLDEEAFCLRALRLPAGRVPRRPRLARRRRLAGALRAPDDAEIARLGATGTGVAHCPTSNARLGAGHRARCATCSTAGVPVGLGVDGAASNESGELPTELRQALLVAARCAAGPHG